MRVTISEFFTYKRAILQVLNLWTMCGSNL